MNGRIFMGYDVHNVTLVNMLCVQSSKVVVKIPTRAEILFWNISSSCVTWQT